MVDQKKLQKNANNIRTSTDKTNDPAKKENEGLCDLVRALRDVLGVYTYHNHKLIKKIMKAQADRIGAALEYAEDRLEKMDPKGGPLEKSFTTDRKDPKKGPGFIKVLETFKRMDEGTLKKQWEDFLTTKYTKSKADIEAFLEKWMKELDQVKVKRSLLEVRGTGQTGSKQCGSATNKSFEKRRKLLRDAYNSKTTWENWFETKPAPTKPAP
jgi:hypothetical protein